MKKIEWYHAIIAFVIWLILSNFIVGPIVMFGAMEFMDVPLSDAMTFQFSKTGIGVSTFVMFATFMFVPYIYIKMLGKKTEILMDFFPFDIKMLAVTIIGMFAFGFLMEGVFAYILEVFPNFNKSVLGLVHERFYDIFGDLDFHRALYEVFNTDNFFVFLMLIVFVGVFPGIGEEFFFRGFMQRILLNKTNFFWAVVLSGGLFGLIHSVQDMSQAVGAFLISFYLGYIYYKTKNLWIPVICHMVNNSFMGSMAYLYPDMMMETSEASLIPILITIPIAVAVIYYLKNFVTVPDRKVESVKINESSDKGDS